MSTSRLYIVDLVDRCNRRIVGHVGGSFSSPRSELQALSLVDALTGHNPESLRVVDSSWTAKPNSSSDLTRQTKQPDNG